MAKINLGEISPNCRDSYEIIPLGIRCSIASFLVKRQLRKQAFPFDWVITPIQSAIALIENDFDGFLDWKNLQYGEAVLKSNGFVENHLTEGRSNKLKLARKHSRKLYPVICKKYNILHVHDFTDNSFETYQEVHSKYHRRVERLKGLLTSDLPLIFVAHDGLLIDDALEQYHAMGRTFENRSQDWGNALSTVLSLKYPQLNFAICEFSDLISWT